MNTGTKMVGGIMPIMPVRIGTAKVHQWSYESANIELQGPQR